LATGSALDFPYHDLRLRRPSGDARNLTLEIASLIVLLTRA
jgi:hypothetical protein